SMDSWTFGSGLSSITWGNDCCQADGSGLYDFNLNFSSNEFVGNDVFVLEMSGAGITADMFAYENTPKGGNGTYHVAAHIQGIGPDNQDSGWIGDTGNPPAVPEASSLLLLGLGLLGLAAGRRKA
ncbi:MAG: PEP-CTERM sorting domain-containing protein, partial [Gammaproteobacteria bacterium]|nr:PEP-CTERM sorting domain-containing protein [Gammaproteobacteria bacterium]